MRMEKEGMHASTTPAHNPFGHIGRKPINTMIFPWNGSSLLTTCRQTVINVAKISHPDHALYDQCGYSAQGSLQQQFASIVDGDLDRLAKAVK